MVIRRTRPLQPIPVIVLLRLWVLWNRQTRLVVWTLLFFIATQIASIAIVSWVVVQMLRE